jgi:Arc/MetJ-type ribon-helix-helix transcriptional regulator
MQRDEPSRGVRNMALSQADHIKAARQQLLNKRLEKEAEIREIDEVLRALDAAPKLLEGKFSSFKSEPEPEEKHRTLANRNVTKLVREYVAEWHKYDEVLSINTIRDDLRRQGVKGKDRSLYSAIHVILKKEADEGHLEYRKGEGFFKSRQDPSRLTREETELVHTS